MRQSLERCYEYGVDLYVSFIDYNQAFDSIDRISITKMLAVLRTLKKILVEITLKDTKEKVVVREPEYFKLLLM